MMHDKPPWSVGTPRQHRRTVMPISVKIKRCPKAVRLKVRFLSSIRDVTGWSLWWLIYLLVDKNRPVGHWANGIRQLIQ